MSKEQLALRMITSEARVNSHRLRTGRLHGEDWGRIANAVESLSELSIYIDDTTDISPMQMRAKCRRVACRDWKGGPTGCLATASSQSSTGLRFAFGARFVLSNPANGIRDGRLLPWVLYYRG